MKPFVWKVYVKSSLHGGKTRAVFQSTVRQECIDIAKIEYHSRDDDPDRQDDQVWINALDDKGNYLYEEPDYLFKGTKADPAPDPDPVYNPKGDLSPGLDPIDRWILENVPGALEATRAKPNRDRDMDLETARLIMANVENDDSDRPLTYRERIAMKTVNDSIEISADWKRSA